MKYSTGGLKTEKMDYFAAFYSPPYFVLESYNCIGMLARRRSPVDPLKELEYIYTYIYIICIYVCVGSN